MIQLILNNLNPLSFKLNALVAGALTSTNHPIRGTQMTALKLFPNKSKTDSIRNIYFDSVKVQLEIVQNLHKSFSFAGKITLLRKLKEKSLVRLAILVLGPIKNCHQKFYPLSYNSLIVLNPKKSVPSQIAEDLELSINFFSLRSYLVQTNYHLFRNSAELQVEPTDLATDNIQSGYEDAHSSSTSPELIKSTVEAAKKLAGHSLGIVQSAYDRTAGIFSTGLVTLTEDSKVSTTADLLLKVSLAGRYLPNEGVSQNQ